MEQKEIDKQPKEGNFFQRLFSMIFRNSNPDAEKKRLLKKISKDLSHSKYKFYKYSSDEILPQFAKFFYEIYKLIGPAQAMIQGIKNPNTFKNAVISYSLTDKQREIDERLSEESITERARKTPLPQLAEEIKNDLSSFGIDFDNEKIQQIDTLYSSMEAFKAFCSFDYFFLLKKFDSSLRERDFNYVPRFETISANYIVDDLKDFLDVAWALPLDQDWTAVMNLFKGIKGVVPVQMSNWNKLMNKLRDLRKDRVFEMILQLILKDPFYTQEVKFSMIPIFTSYVESVKNQTTASLKKIEQDKKNSKIEQLLKSIFGTTVILRLKNYSEGGNSQYERKGIHAFTYDQPMNYMKAFLIDYFKKDIREYSDIVLVRGQWVSTVLSNQLSEIYHSILTVSDQINDLDQSLSEEAELGVRLKHLLLRCDKDHEAKRVLKLQLKEVNEKALNILSVGSQQLVTFAREVKNLIEDKEKSKPQLLINWKELEHFSDKPLREYGVEIYKMIYQFVTLMQMFLKKQ